MIQIFQISMYLLHIISSAYRVEVSISLFLFLSPFYLNQTRRGEIFKFSFNFLYVPNKIQGVKSYQIGQKAQNCDGSRGTKRIIALGRLESAAHYT